MGRRKLVVGNWKMNGMRAHLEEVEAIGRVAAAVGGASPRHNTFRHLGSFAVAAAPAFIRELIRQPEVASAVANRRG